MAEDSQAYGYAASFGLAPSCEEAVVQQLRDNAALRPFSAPLRLQRAIGVIYRPDTERQSHYFLTRLADHFDAMVHIDQTSAVEPLDKGPVWHTGEVPETYPTGM